MSLGRRQALDRLGRTSIALACGSGLPAARSAPPAGLGRTLQVGDGRTIRALAEAARIAQDGDTVVIDAGVYRGDVAVWSQDRLTLRAQGGRVRLQAAGAAAEGKALWVVRGGEIAIEDIDFEGARVPSGNGAGIRFERGRLTVRRCRFFDNEMGLLANNDPTQELVVEDC